MSKIDLTTSDLLPFVPPAIGAVLGIRYAQNQTGVERLVSWGLSMALGLYVGAAVGEYFNLGRVTTGGVQFALAAVGMEVVAYVIAALRQATADPVAAFRHWLNAWLGRSDQ